MRNIRVVVVMAACLIFFPYASQAGKGRAIGKILSGTAVMGSEKPDLSKAQLRDCMLLKRKVNRQIDAIEQINSQLTPRKKEIDRRSSYIKKRRSQVKNLSNKQIRSLNNIIKKHQRATAAYNKKVYSLQGKMEKYEKDQNLFSTTCADKSYRKSDMESVIAEIDKEEKTAKKSEVKTKSKSGKYSLTINSTPANAKIRIMNITPKFKQGMLLKPGKYDISVTHPKYHEYREWITIKDSSLNVDVVLKEQ